MPLQSLHILDGIEPRERLAEHVKWAERRARPLYPAGGGAGELTGVPNPTGRRPAAEQRPGSRSCHRPSRPPREAGQRRHQFPWLEGLGDVDLVSREHGAGAVFGPGECG
jgi:hypothetical protein